MFKFIILDKLTQTTTTCKFPMIPRVGDTIPFYRFPNPIVKSVYLNIPDANNILLDNIVKRIGIDTTITDWRKISAVITID